MEVEKLKDGQSSCCNRLRLEFYILITLLGTVLRGAVVKQLTQDKVCVTSKGYSNLICKNLHQEAYIKELNSVLPETNDYSLYEKAIVHAPSLLLMFFVGSWIDKYRGAVKAILLVTTGASLVESALLFFNAYYFEWHTWILLLAFIPPGLTGGRMITITTVITQVTIETPQEQLSMRIALVHFCIMIGASFGGLLVGPLLKLTPFASETQPQNYTGIFLLCLLFDAISVLWILYTVDTSRETSSVTTVELSEIKAKPENNVDKKDLEANSKSDKQLGLCSKFLQLWDIQNVTEAFKICTVKRPNYGRLKIWLLILASCIILANFMAPMSFMFQFTEITMGWDINRFNVVNSIASLISTPLGLLAVPLCVKVFKLDDTTLGILGSISAVSASLIKGIFTTEMGYYLSHAAGILGGMIGIATKSIVKPLVEENEIGRLFTFVHVSEMFADLALSPIVTKLFNKTYETMPGFVFILLGFSMLIPLIVFCVMKALKSDSSVENEKTSL